jgi:hypothetical protein
MKQLMGIALATLLAAGVAQPISAQAKRPRFGVVGGLNFAKWTGDDVGSGAETRTGFHAGGVITVDLSPSLGIQSGLVYSQEGTSADFGGGVTGKIQMDYLQIPVYLKLQTTLQGSTPLRPHLYAGPALGVRVRCRVEASSGGTSASADCNDSGLDTKSTEFGAHFGGGVDIGRFTIGGRYQLGLSSIDDSGADADVKNSVFAITAGYRF